ncbi:myoD family inhibitor domain-containing protein [Corythoichthys intestinalis]|uniref:myoD family inhibitor domain-containing protein n=1 Tax=Corythoichthys intestinalis TaxID=161448 RepID=UPI0025A60683|nr:myoD family inhibitor domain-containing protein [Corythoichthys intestinalis]XP_057702904.1 myoD family inhibitor domain-containing protein [Corythoichthys intestinalis]XP_057702905.1 myoD family inhibitor domain-containing protein [Corythoichthys intestinalis]XP_061814269.1 myoD family inhibitor domain-containing protein-like [Nerophis lumbriciformis]
MDEERSAPTISPEPPDDGDPFPALHVTATVQIENTNFKPTSSRDVANTYTEPLIIRSDVIPERTRGDDGEKCKNGLSHTAPGDAITCQPAARSTPIHPTQPCRTQPSSQARNGTKHHTHTNSPHCSHPTPHTHSLQSGGDRNGGPHPKLGSLPRGGSSSSSSSSAGTRNSKKLQSNPSITSQGSKRSKGSSKSSSKSNSSKSNSSQIPTEAQDDCCVHCILACLFCEFLTLCNIVLDCATCGSCAGDDSCFCCCCASEECGDCDLPCDMDCGIIDACCESADCLEICMECCSLCFSS